MKIFTNKQKKKFQINLDIDIKYHSSDEDNYIDDNIIETKIDGDNYNTGEALSEEENTSKQKQPKSSLKSYEKMFNSTVTYILCIVNGTGTSRTYSVYSSNVLSIDIESLTFIGTCEYDLHWFIKHLRQMDNKAPKLGKNFEIEKLSYSFYMFTPDEYLTLHTHMSQLKSITSLTVNIICICGGVIRKENVKLPGNIVNEKKCESCGKFLSLEITEYNKPVKTWSNERVCGITLKIEKGSNSGENIYTVKFNKYNAMQYVKQYLSTLLADMLIQ
jgi:hypothetical protein